MDLQVQIPLNLIVSFEIKSGPALLPVFNFLMHLFTSLILKDEVLLTVSYPIFPSILIAKSLLTGSLKNISIMNCVADLLWRSFYLRALPSVN
jgi:hypothetical protein